MTRQEFLTNYWEYYLMLEKKMIDTLDYVELCNDNFSTYSNRYASLMQSVGSELDEFFKVYCSFPLSERKTITDYANYLFANDTSIINTELLVSEKRISIVPFLEWDKSKAAKSLFWWQAFDNIKHSRTLHFSDASLINAINILGALFILESKYLVRITNIENEPDIIPSKESSLFAFKIPITHALSLKNACIF